MLFAGIIVGSLLGGWGVVWVGRKFLDWLAQESHDRMCRISDREARAHRITVNFAVGKDCK